MSCRGAGFWQSLESGRRVFVRESVQDGGCYGDQRVGQPAAGSGVLDADFGTCENGVAQGAVLGEERAVAGGQGQADCEAGV